MDFSACYVDTMSSVAVAARLGDRRRLRRLLREGRSVSCTDNRGWMPLHEAAHAGMMSCLKDILSAARTGVSLSEFRTYVNSSTHEGETACFLAARGGHVGAVRRLLKSKAKIDQLTNDLSCPLYAAVDNGHIEVVRLLMDKGAELNRSHTATCWTCLHLAVYRDHVDIVRMLVQSAELEVRDDYNMTPLFLAAKHGRQQCLEILIHAGSRVLCGVAAGAQRQRQLELQLRLAPAAHPRRRTVRPPRVAARFSAKRGSPRILRRLLPVTIRQCDRGEGLVSPLYLAIQGGQAACVALLLDQGFSPDAQSRLHSMGPHSPLSLAFHSGYSDISGMLLAAGAALHKWEWKPVLGQKNSSLLKLVLEHRWLYPPRHPRGDSSKVALRRPELDDMLRTALKLLEFAVDWLPPLLRAGLDPDSLLRSIVLEKVDSELLNFLLQFVNWSTMSPALKSVLWRRRAQETWHPLPQFDSVPDLSHLCRLRIRTLMGPEEVMRTDAVGELPVPPSIQRFLQFT
ncbi:ankyrin repeat and SOCS box protein 3 isoform X2 [Syngnathus acus]|uniref:ankyrin repeat and SOCS box protein 3 isoform X2 n=1 Tax=Syngnathus acus TaxID=161584 RepID=UPI0018863635|nr:ankyrin repeat and SOCS box protein 3 isoform X2 [Syngnathus acus]